MTGSLTTAAIAPLLRDEVFLIETPRLWLRWPTAADAEALQVAASRQCVAAQTSSWPHPLPPGFAAARIERIRATNPTGKGLSLVLARKVNPARAIGLVGVHDVGDSRLDLGYLLEYASHGRGLMSEAVAAFVFNLFTYGRPASIVASTLPTNVSSQSVLEKCGFHAVGQSRCAAPARGGEVEARAFELYRADWREHVALTRTRARTGFLEREARVA